MDQLLARVGVSCSGRKKLLEGLEHSLSDTVLNLTVQQVHFTPSWKPLRTGSRRVSELDYWHVHSSTCAINPTHCLCTHHFRFHLLNYCK